MDRAFSHDQLALVAHALRDAEDLTCRYYCIPPHAWQRVPYDVVTVRDAERRPLPERVLAETVRLERTNPKRKGRADLYRIQLNDPTILDAAWREELGGGLYPLLLYVLTHEMVHVVRLSAILDAVAEGQIERESEEHRVERISRQILVKAPHPGVSRIVDAFWRHNQAAAAS